MVFYGVILKSLLELSIGHEKFQKNLSETID